LPPQCQTNFARTSGSHSLWILNQVQSLCNSFSNHNDHGNRPVVLPSVAGNSVNSVAATNSINIATTNWQFVKTKIKFKTSELESLAIFRNNHAHHRRISHGIWNQEADVVWTSLGPLPRWVPGPTTRWAPGTTRLGLHGTCWRRAQGPQWRITRIGSYACPLPCRELLHVHD
jgi:hypothetical protein